MNLAKFIEENRSLIAINAYEKNLDNQDIMSVCKFVLENGFNEISSLPQNIDNIWRWSEKSNVAISSIIDNSAGDLSIDEKFQAVKNMNSLGVSIINYIPKKDFTESDFKEVVNLIYKAKFKKINLFIVLEKYVFEDFNKAKNIIEMILKNEKINGIKLSSGIAGTFSNSNLANFVLDCIKDKKRNDNFYLNVFADLFDKNNFSDAENIYRIASVIMGREWANNYLSLSFSYDIFKNNFVFIQK